MRGVGSLLPMVAFFFAGASVRRVRPPPRELAPFFSIAEHPSPSTGYVMGTSYRVLCVLQQSSSNPSSQPLISRTIWWFNTSQTSLLDCALLCITGRKSVAFPCPAWRSALLPVPQDETDSSATELAVLVREGGISASRRVSRAPSGTLVALEWHFARAPRAKAQWAWVPERATCAIWALARALSIGRDDSPTLAQVPLRFTTIASFPATRI